MRKLLKVLSSSFLSALLLSSSFAGTTTVSSSSSQPATLTGSNSGGAGNCIQVQSGEIYCGDLLIKARDDGKIETINGINTSVDSSLISVPGLEGSLIQALDPGRVKDVTLYSAELNISKDSFLTLKRYMVMTPDEKFVLYDSKGSFITKGTWKKEGEYYVFKGDYCPEKYPYYDPFSGCSKFPTKVELVPFQDWLSGKTHWDSSIYSLFPYPIYLYGHYPLEGVGFGGDPPTSLLFDFPDGAKYALFFEYVGPIIDNNPTYYSNLGKLGIKDIYLTSGKLVRLNGRYPSYDYLWVARTLLVGAGWSVPLSTKVHIDFDGHKKDFTLTKYWNIVYYKNPPKETHLKFRSFINMKGTVDVEYRACADFVDEEVCAVKSVPVSSGVSGILKSLFTKAELLTDKVGGGKKKLDGLKGELSYYAFLLKDGKVLVFAGYLPVHVECRYVDTFSSYVFYDSPGKYYDYTFNDFSCPGRYYGKVLIEQRRYFDYSGVFFLPLGAVKLSDKEISQLEDLKDLISDVSAGATETLK